MRMFHLTRGWYAEEPLWVVFWGYGVGLSLLLIGALFAPALTAKISLVHYVLAVCILGVYTEWILSSIWHCADRVENKLWGTVARFLTVAWAINMALVLLFMGPYVVRSP